MAYALHLPATQVFKSVRKGDKLFVGTRTEVEWLSRLLARNGFGLLVERLADP